MPLSIWGIKTLPLTIGPATNCGKKVIYNKTLLKLVGFIKEYEQIWLKRNRLGGLKDSRNRWITLIDEYMPKE